MRTPRMMLRAHGAAVSLSILVAIAHANADAGPAFSRLEDIPITRAIVFKDGTAMFVHQGPALCDAAGDITILGLPIPMLGTFWANTTDPAASVRSITAARAPSPVERPAADFTDLLAANISKRVTLTLDADTTIVGTILSLPEPVQPRPDPRMYGYGQNADHVYVPPPVRPGTVLISSADGIAAVSIASIRNMTLPADAATSVLDVSEGPTLVFDLAWDSATTPPSVPVELMYLQRGLRWIPNYRVTVMPDGTAAFEFQASVINDAIDLEDVPTEFIVGVPSFAFAGAVDPMSLLNIQPSLSSFFSFDRAGAALTAIASQVGRMYRAQMSDADSGPNPMPIESQGDDQFIFTVPSLTLAKGARAAVPLKHFDLHVEDRYRLHLSIAPPSPFRRSSNDQRFTDLDRALSAPAVGHALVFTNTSDIPLTTAPALVLKDGRPMAQSVCTYTPIGAPGELQLSTAVDISAQGTVTEIKRELDAFTDDNRISYTRITLKGVIKIINRKNVPAEVQVTRDIVGNAASTSGSPTITHFSRLSDTEAVAGAEASWWNWYDPPAWFTAVNPISRIEWNVPIEPGETVTLEYECSYYWN